jgi:hypothetical protein
MFSMWEARRNLAGTREVIVKECRDSERRGKLIVQSCNML